MWKLQAVWSVDLEPEGGPGGRAGLQSPCLAAFQGFQSSQGSGMLQQMLLGSLGREPGATLLALRAW